MRMVTIGFICLGGILGASAWAQPQPSASGFVQVEEDVRLFYQRFGTGRPTVFVPNRHELIHSFASLFEAHDVVAWDPRGRGLSSRPDDLSRYGLEAEIADAEAMREHFGVERVTYVGMSLWGSIGLLYAARHPEHVERVVALGPLPVAAELITAPDRPVSHELRLARRELDRMRFEGTGESHPYDVCRLEMYLEFANSYVDLANMAPFHEANLCQYANEHSQQILPVIFGGIFASFGDWDWREDLARVDAPVLMIFGRHENWSLDGVRAYAVGLRDVGWMEVANAGHHVWNEAPEVVLPMIDTFLQGRWPDGVHSANGDQAGLGAGAMRIHRGP